MKQIGQAIENFAFKSFDLNGRATLLEYWLMMTLVWGAIAFLLYGDAVEFWGMLLARQVPTFNPLYWDGILVFLITIIPRFSLTVRRLHDSGKNGKWAKLPFLTLLWSVVLFVGAMTTIASHSGDNAATLSMLSVVIALSFGTSEAFWPMVFGGAAILDALGWDAIWAILSDLSGSMPKPDLAAGVSNISNGLRTNPAETGSTLIAAIVMISIPFVTASLHIFFMISPTKPDHELDTFGPIAGASLRKQGDVSENPFSSYKHLYEKTPEQKAAAAAYAKQEIKSLYQQRVLGQQQTN